MMSNILGEESREHFVQFVEGNPLLAFDYDGTLAPLSANRHKTPMRERTRQLLTEVAGKHTCAVITGRSRGDMLSILGNIPITAVVGNHGSEPSENQADFLRRSRSWIPLLSHALSHIEGVELEDKGLSLSAHYRAARNRNAALSAIMSAARPMRGSMRAVPGHEVVNFIPAGAPDKSDALRNLMRKLQAETAIFVGDDQTDEDVFSRAQPGRVLTIRVGESATSRAEYFLDSQLDVDALLQLIRDQ